MGQSRRASGETRDWRLPLSLRRGWESQGAIEAGTGSLPLFAGSLQRLVGDWLGYSQRHGAFSGNASCLGNRERGTTVFTLDHTSTMLLRFDVRSPYIPKVTLIYLFEQILARGSELLFPTTPWEAERRFPDGNVSEWRGCMIGDASGMQPIPGGERDTFVVYYGGGDAVSGAAVVRVRTAPGGGRSS